MPDGGRFWGVGGQNLTTMVRNGSLIESRLTDSEFFVLIVCPWINARNSGYQNRGSMVSTRARCEFPINMQ